MKEYTILIAEDHQMFRESLRESIDKEKSLKVIGEANDGEDLVKQYKLLEPNLLLVDINLPKLNGLEAVKIIKEINPNVKVLVITMYRDKFFIREAKKCNVNGYIYKFSGLDYLFHAIYSILSGEEIFDSSVKKFMEDLENNQNLSQSKEYLTTREKEVLSLLAEGLSSKEIANTLFISVNTVNNHRKNILQKFDQPNMISLIQYAKERGIL